MSFCTVETAAAMNIQTHYKKYAYFWSFAAAFGLIALFGSVEVVRRAPLSHVAGIAMLVLFFVFFLLAYKRGKIEWVLFLYVFIQPMTRFPVYVYGPIRLSFVLLMLAVGGHLVAMYQKKSWFRIKIGKLIFPQFLFLCAIILSTLVNISHVSSFERITLHVANFLFVLLLPQIIDSSKKLLRLIIVWCASISFLSVFGIFTSIFARAQNGKSTLFFQTAIDGIIRIASLTPDSNYFAVLLFVPLSIGLAILLSHRNDFSNKYKVFFWIFVPIFITTALLTYSRAGLLALGMVLFCFIFFEKQFLRYTFWVKFGILVLSALVLSVIIQPDFLRNMIFRFPDSVISQNQKIQYGSALTFDKSHIAFRGNASGVTSGVLTAEEQEIIANDAIDVRGLYWGVAIKMFRAHPILGVGAGEYPYQFEKYLGYIYFAKLPNTHDIFLETLAEFGIVGLLTLLFLLIRSLIVLRNLYRFSTGPRRALVYALGVSYVASVFQYSFQPSFNSMNLWFLLGMFGILECMNREEIQKFNRSLSPKRES